MVVSIKVQEKKVLFIERLKNSLNIQKAVSLTCDIKTLPAPTASTNNSGETFDVTSSGATIPEAVIPATVAEPSVTRNNAVTTHANTRTGMCQLVLRDDM